MVKFVQIYNFPPISFKWARESTEYLDIIKLVSGSKIINIRSNYIAAFYTNLVFAVSIFYKRPNSDDPRLLSKLGIPILRFDCNVPCISLAP